MLGCRSPHHPAHRVTNSSLACDPIPVSGLHRSLRGQSCRLAPAVRGPCQPDLRRSIKCRRLAASAERYSIPSPPGVHDAEEIPWQDSSTDVAFIGMCRKAYGKLAGWQSDADWKDGAESYRGMIEVSRALMKVLRSARRCRDAYCSRYLRTPSDLPYGIAGQNSRAAAGRRHRRLPPGGDLCCSANVVASHQMPWVPSHTVGASMVPPCLSGDAVGRKAERAHHPCLFLVAGRVQGADFQC
jgi:hypothetical protein